MTEHLVTDTGQCVRAAYRATIVRAIARLGALLLFVGCVADAARAQPAPTPPPAAAPAPDSGPAAPSLINPRLRLDMPALRIGTVRFLTSDDRPPFNFTGPDGALAGYTVDLARAVCGEIKLPCTIQARRSDLLADALASGAGDALLYPTTPDTRFALSLPFLPTAARFAARNAAAEATADGLAGRMVGVVADSTAAEFLRRFFPAVRAEPFPSRAALLAALAAGTVDLVFADAAELAFWLNGVAANGCCHFVGGAFLDPALFGAGETIAVRIADDDLRRAIDAALARLDARGALTDLYLRYFPVPAF